MISLTVTPHPVTLDGQRHLSVQLDAGDTLDTLLAAGMALEAAALVVPPDAPRAGPVKAALYCRAADCYRAVEHNDFETDADRAKAAWMERNASETARRIACDG